MKRGVTQRNERMDTAERKAAGEIGHTRAKREEARRRGDARKRYEKGSGEP